jgi:hypothetical protein
MRLAILGLLLFLAATTPHGAAAQDPAAVAPAIAALKKLGGRIETDAAQAGIPVVAVSLRNTKCTNDDLKHLRHLPALRRLDLSHTDIGNEGLAEIKDLTQLEELNLAFTLPTDDGLVYLKGLIKLKALDLEKPCKGPYTPESRFTDKALLHLKGMTRLESLNMDWNMLSDSGLEQLKGMTSLRQITLGFQTKVTEEGRANLRKSLPKATIH